MSSDLDKDQRSEPDIFQYSNLEDKFKPFAAVLKNIQVDNLARYVWTIYKANHQHEDNEKGNEKGKATVIPLSVSARALAGSSHILIPVNFWNGTRWLLKVPRKGTQDQFTADDARDLRSEVLTMQLLRRETTIPVPEVFAFSTNFNNKLGFPFILMTYLPGAAVSKIWYKELEYPSPIRETNAQTLEDLAAAMIQLNKFTFDKIGRIDFNEHDEPSEIRPLRELDLNAMRRQSGDDETREPIYTEIGPFETPSHIIPPT
ncbi:uncharacterized protein TRUGW13939_07429 [Talaromyces rugulosus]|uniref:Aminoglycoside phosphotransferase domain-containing protein n=1 Tax=Talaromyces rugulosus TaxID=121627 RepID=A0A7H8R2G9_TALRU|nr:uncharacterized protein TRUGW13939_07429 [Talaromyces rugulosus]QKX60286.1 hypothetical protein TRUGW13939_07429 [Talaromyces rugulosus]